jgi:hypothetical protein
VIVSALARKFLVSGKMVQNHAKELSKIVGETGFEEDIELWLRKSVTKVELFAKKL